MEPCPDDALGVVEIVMFGPPLGGHVVVVHGVEVVDEAVHGVRGYDDLALDQRFVLASP